MKDYGAPLLCLCALLSVTFAQEEVTIIDVDPIAEGDLLILQSSQLTYPSANNFTLWRFKHDIEVTVRSLKINGQRGDFLLLSKQPFVSSGMSPIPMQEVIEKFPIDESILFVFEPKVNTVIRLLHEDGVTIFFHGYGDTVSPPRDFQFRIEIAYFERKPEETPSTTEHIPTIPAGQTENDYVTKFVTGKTPTQFVNELDIFREVLANMTDKYCQYKGIQLVQPTTISNVVVPQEDLRFCSRSWSTFKECVEVTFAIVTYDINGDYAMTGDRTNEMWDMYPADLTANGYNPYVPPKDPEHTAGWIWVLGSLGSVIVVSVLLCLAWLKKASDELNRDKEMSKAMTQMTDEEKFYDRANPLHQLRKTMVNGKLGNGEDHDSGQGSWDRGQGLPGYYVPSFDGSDSSDIYRVNKLYVPDEEEEEEEYFRRPDSRIPTQQQWAPPNNIRSPFYRQQNFAFEDDE